MNFIPLPSPTLRHKRVFHSWIWESAAGWVYKRRSKGRYVNILKHARARTKLCNINRKGQTATWKEIYIECMQSKALSKYLWNVLRFSFHKNYFFVGNKIVMKTSSVAITDQLSNIWCFAWFGTIHWQFSFALSITKLKQREKHP